MRVFEQNTWELEVRYKVRDQVRDQVLEPISVRTCGRPAVAALVITMKLISRSGPALITLEKLRWSPVDWHGKQHNRTGTVYSRTEFNTFYKIKTIWITSFANSGLSLAFSFCFRFAKFDKTLSGVLSVLLSF